MDSTDTGFFANAFNGWRWREMVGEGEYWRATY